MTPPKIEPRLSPSHIIIFGVCSAKWALVRPCLSDRRKIKEISLRKRESRGVAQAQKHLIVGESAAQRKKRKVTIGVKREAPVARRKKGFPIGTPEDMRKMAKIEGLLARLFQLPNIMSPCEPLIDKQTKEAGLLHNADPGVA